MKSHITPIILLLLVTCSAMAGTLRVDSTAPVPGPVDYSNYGSYSTLFGADSSNPYFSRGQTFTTADTGDSNTQWSVSELAIRSRINQNLAPGDALKLWVMEWQPASANNDSNWITGDGLSDGDPLDGTSLGGVVVNGEVYDLPPSVTSGDYYHFELDPPLLLDENRSYAVFFEFVDADFTVGDKTVRIGIAGGGDVQPDGMQLRTTESGNQSYIGQDLTLIVSGAVIGGSSLKFAAPFQSGMVLQRDKPLKVWGKSDPSTPVALSINGTTASGTSDANGDWSLTLPALASGGPFDFVATSGANTATLDDVLVGDVWVTFGQSNMVRPLSEMTGSAAYINDIVGNDLPIRCLKISQFAATTEQEEGLMIWIDNSNPGSWTSVGTVFATKMYHATGVPTAIIWAAWGSSSIEGWMPLSMTEQFPHFADVMADYYANEEAKTIGILAKGYPMTFSDDIYIRQRPNIIYNQMIHPIRNVGISGFVWYQGEANAGDVTDAVQYGFTLPGFVPEYRKRFDQGDLPFLGVQLPSFNQSAWPWFREAQTKVSVLPNAYLAVTIDTGLSGNIHPPDKEPIGERLSLLARKYVHSETIEAHGPMFSSLSVTGNEAMVSFSSAAGLTTDNGQPPATFEVAGSDQVFQSATSASISGSTVTISATTVANPVAVRYAWSAAPVNQLNLVNSSGLPAAPFRTDAWPVSGLGAKAPQSVNDSFEIVAGQTLSVPASGVLGNDIDLNYDALTASLITDVDEGTLDLLTDGSFTYTAEIDFTGTDSFVYRASDGALDSPDATVSITVAPAPDPYAAWQSSISWNAGDDTMPDGDPDSDGVSNFLEFALDLDPLLSNSDGLPELTRVGSDFEFEFNNVQPGVIYQVLVSDDLTAWIDPPFAELTSESTMPVQIPASQATGSRLFVRLRVSQ